MYKLGRLKNKIEKLDRKIEKLTIERTKIDDNFANGTKSILENLAFAKRMAVKDVERKFVINSLMVYAHLKAARIYVNPENIYIDLINGFCNIKLNDNITAKVKIIDTTEETLVI